MALFGVDNGGADSGWVVDGSRTGWKWDGERWSAVRLPARASDVARVSGDDVWAVGSVLPTADSTAELGPAAMRWDGHAWHSVHLPDFLAGEPTPGPDELQGEDDLAYEASLTLLVVRSAEDIRAVGSVGGEGGQDAYDNQLVLRWDGSQWTKEASGTTRCCVTGQAGGVALLGSAYYLGESGAVERIGKPPSVAGRSGEITAVDRKQELHLNDQTAIPGTHQIWAAGAAVLDAHGDANFQRPVVSRRSQPH
ncbi:hypothetical protein [Streptomyces sp. NPDC048508]|uniref:hypothetical protein n=1 Tax=Streptomyces sp. NPDC048508 TaxID=3365561 RepID=UPI003714DAD8